MEKEYVTCLICGHKYLGKVPRHGDGSVLFPRLHYIRKVKNEYKKVCEGSFIEALEYHPITNPYFP